MAKSCPINLSVTVSTKDCFQICVIPALKDCKMPITITSDRPRDRVETSRKAAERGLKHYVEHAHDGLSLRQIARREGLHPSTVLRQVRQIESLRDDPLIDAALHRIVKTPPKPSKKDTTMTATLRPQPALQDAQFQHEALRILRRLAEPAAKLVLASDLEKAVVIKTTPDGRQTRTATLDRTSAEAFVLKDWITCEKPGRVASYAITSAGRAALRRMLAQSEGMAEAPSPFAEQHRLWGEKVVTSDEGEEPKRLRYNMAESPVVALGRRRDKDGVPYLTPDQVAAGERLREDFELAQMGPRVAQNWDRFLVGRGQSNLGSGAGATGGPQSARDRVALALRELGPGLADMALRCCCHLEGLEATEKHLGWAARSGKVVLRIALDRLHRHYEETYGAKSRMIG